MTFLIECLYLNCYWRSNRGWGCWKSNRGGDVGDQIGVGMLGFFLTMPHLGACSKPRHGFLMSCVMVFLCSKIAVCFVDITRIVDLHCVNLLVIKSRFRTKIDVLN